MRRYINYHKHTDYSNIMTLDCIVKPEDYCKRAVELGHTEYVTTEHGYQGNIFDAYTLCKQYNLRCIYGVEAYYVDNRHEKDKGNYHICLIAMTENGRKSINKILAQANLDGYYYKPRIDLELLVTLNPDDVVVTTACVASRLFKGDNWETDFFIPVFKHFGKSLYLEVQNHNHDVQKEHNKKILELSSKYGVKIIHANDSHYIMPEDAKYRSLFLTGKGLNYGDEDSFLLDYPDYDTIVERYREQGILTDEQIYEALDNTLVFDNSESVHIDDDFKIPKITEGDSNKTLRRIVNECWNKEKNNIPKEQHQHYIDEIRYEVGMICKCNMADYFIIDHLIVKKAVDEYGAVLTRTGRGSAVSFYVNKLLGLTELDRIWCPIKLYPSRFLSDTRILASRSLPDIDQNYADVEPVIKASQDYLGEDGIRQMIVFKPLQNSSAFRLWCKAIGMNIKEYDEVAKDLSNEKGEYTGKYSTDEKWSKLIKDSQRFKGVIESVAPSPCSYLLLDKNISEEIGLISIGSDKNKVICCCIDGYNSDKYKFLKNDYLIVTVWDIISKVYKSIGQPIDDIHTLLSKCDDQVWQLYADGMSATLNQADTDYDKQILTKYKPHSFEEMSAYVAAIRPAFAKQLQTFVNRQPYSTGVKELDDLLSDSFHYMMYQENVMSILSWLGIPEKDTYDIIKKISKHKFKPEELNALKDTLKFNWIKKLGTIDHFKETWDNLEASCGYAFNACVSGDTKIMRSSTGDKWIPTVEEMYKIKNDIEYAKRTGHKHLSQKYRGKNGYGKALSMCEDKRIRQNNIVDIYYSGKADIYRVETESGEYIDCTMNHKFPTPNGKKKLEELSVGDELFVKGQYEINHDRYALTDGNFIRNVPHKGQQGFQKNENGNSVLFDKIANRCKEQRCACRICNKPYNDTERFELHHYDMDRTNNKEDNLWWLCCSCHKKEHYKNGRTKKYEKGIPVLTSKIRSITFLRNDDVYDIEMQAPNHNFISESGLITSNSHSASVALDSMYGAYLKSHYPLDYFSVVFNTYKDDITKTSVLAKELPYFGIKLSPIKFRHSSSDYMPDKENNVIYKGISSIKFMNKAVANKLYDLRDKEFSTFIDYLVINPCDSRSTTALIKLNYFSEFGKSQYLLDIYDLYCKYHGSKIIKKDNCEFDRDFMLQFATETDKQYRLTDSDGFLKALCDQVPNRSITIKEYLDAQSEYLGYIDYINPKAVGYGYVMSVDTKYSPKLTMYELDTGKTTVYKMSKKTFATSGIKQGSILKFTYMVKAKTKMVDGSWVKDFSVQEPWIDKFMLKEKL